MKRPCPFRIGDVVKLNAYDGSRYKHMFRVSTAMRVSDCEWHPDADHSKGGWVLTIAGEGQRVWEGFVELAEGPW